MSNQSRDLSTNPSADTARFVTWLGWIIAAVGCVVIVMRLVWPSAMTGSARWPEVLLLAGLKVTLVASLCRQLPLQNVLLAAAVTAGFGGIAHGVNAWAGVPFGPQVFTGSAGPELFGKLPVTLPLVWVVVILSSRGVARLVLRPWRKLRAYGLWLIGFTALLTALLAGGLEPFASRTEHYWYWGKTRIPVDWHGVPVTVFLCWALMTLLIMAFITPPLINKKTSRQSAPDFHPLAAWLVLGVLFGIGAATERMASAVVYCVLTTLLVGVFAMRGARW
ncbi:MAG TPA: carotenoid biosynthesis protein [Verrucomicrobiota bacterium]|nr:carotenoid biosynthesis protein [Verrucomicrobiota bacterium]